MGGGIGGTGVGGGVGSGVGGTGVGGAVGVGVGGTGVGGAVGGGVGGSVGGGGGVGSGTQSGTDVGRPPGQPLEQTSVPGQKKDARAQEHVICSPAALLLQGTGVPVAFVFALWQIAPCHVGRYTLMRLSQFRAQ